MSNQNTLKKESHLKSTKKRKCQKKSHLSISRLLSSRFNFLSSSLSVSLRTKAWSISVEAGQSYGQFLFFLGGGTFLDEKLPLKFTLLYSYQFYQHTNTTNFNSGTKQKFRKHFHNMVLTPTLLYWRAELGRVAY